jgi:hypothetical protein
MHLFDVHGASSEISLEHLGRGDGTVKVAVVVLVPPAVSAAAYQAAPQGTAAVLLFSGRKFDTVSFLAAK